MWYVASLMAHEIIFGGTVLTIVRERSHQVIASFSKLHVTLPIKKSLFSWGNKTAFRIEGYSEFGCQACPVFVSIYLTFKHIQIVI